MEPKYTIGTVTEAELSNQESERAIMAELEKEVDRLAAECLPDGTIEILATTIAEAKNENWQVSEPELLALAKRFRGPIGKHFESAAQARFDQLVAESDKKAANLYLMLADAGLAMANATFFREVGRPDLYHHELAVAMCSVSNNTEVDSQFREMYLTTSDLLTERVLELFRASNGSAERLVQLAAKNNVSLDRYGYAPDPAPAGQQEPEQPSYAEVRDLVAIVLKEMAVSDDVESYLNARGFIDPYNTNEY